MKVTVERAHPEELVEVRHRVLRAGRPRETAHFAGDDAPGTRHWVARIGGRTVGVVSVMEAAMPAPHPTPRPTWQLRGMAVLADLQGQGVGTALVERVVAEVAAPLWCNARLGALPFYAACGWQSLGETFHIEPIGPHVRMHV